MTLDKVSFKRAKVLYSIMDSVFEEIWKRQSTVLKGNDGERRFNPFVRFIVTKIMNRYNTIMTTKSEPLKKLFSSAYGLRSYVVLLNGIPCGFFFMRRMTESSWLLGPFGVLIEFRGRGVGRFIVEEAKRIASSHGGTRIITGIVVDETHKQFLKMGFRDEMTSWDMFLDL